MTIQIHVKNNDPQGGRSIQVQDVDPATGEPLNAYATEILPGGEASFHVHEGQAVIVRELLTIPEPTENEATAVDEPPPTENEATAVLSDDMSEAPTEEIPVA